jgi:hypothetical protein
VKQRWLIHVHISLFPEVSEWRDFRKSNDVQGTGRKYISLFTFPEVQDGALCVKLDSPFFSHCFNGCNQIAEIHFSNI